MILEAYLKMDRQSAEIFRGTFIGKRALVIGTGMSTRKLVKYRDQLSDHFDAIIGLNLAIYNFEDQITHHLVLEKNPVKVYTHMHNNPDHYCDAKPRILNWKGIHRFPSNLNIIKATRTDFGGRPNIRKYNYNGCEGFMNGPTSPEGFSTGSVGLHGLHLAGILGCNEVYLSGIDLVFGKDFDHYYEDRFYRGGGQGKNKSPIINVGNKETTQFFKDSADQIDKIINTLCKPINMKIYSFSNGLLTAPTYVDIDTFFEVQ